MHIDAQYPLTPWPPNKYRRTRYLQFVACLEHLLFRLLYLPLHLFQVLLSLLLHECRKDIGLLLELFELLLCQRLLVENRSESIRAGFQ